MVGTVTLPNRSFTLNSIPRYAKITSFTIDAVTAIQFRFNYKVDRAVDAVQYSLNGGGWTAQPGGNIITGRSPNTSYTIKIRVRNTASGLWTESNTLTVRTIALSSVSSSVNFNLESSLGVTIARSNSNMVHDIYLESYYGNAWRDVAKNALTNIGTSATVTPTSEAVTTLQNKYPNTKSVQVRMRIVCRWGSGGTIQGTVYKTGTATIVNANPSIASVSYADVDSTVQAILGNNQKILRNKSNLRVTAGQASSQKGAFLKTYKVTIGGNEYNAAAESGLTSETGKTINVGKVNQAANQTAVLTIIDSRGNTASRSFTVQMLDYQPPQFLQASADRLNNYEEPTTMNVEARRAVVKPGSVDVNDVELRYRIKQNPSGSYGSYVNLTKANKMVSGIWQSVEVSQYMADYPNNQSYTVEVGISDKFTGWDTILITLTEGIALLRFLQDKIEAGVPIVASDIRADKQGVGKDWEQGALDVAGDFYVDGVLQNRAPDIPAGDGNDIEYWRRIKQGVYFVRPSTITGQPTKYGMIVVQKYGNAEFNIVWYSQWNGTIYRKSGNSNSITEWIIIHSGDYIQSKGVSTSWGNTFGAHTGAFNAILGTGNAATWLLSGTSNGVFKGGIQLYDPGTSMRFFCNDNYYTLGGSSGTIWHDGNVSYRTSGNSYCIKFPSGLMIQTKDVYYSGAIKTVWGSGYAADIDCGNFIWQEFVAMPRVFVEAKSGGYTVLAGRQGTGGANNKIGGTTLFRPSAAPNTSGYEISILAIGRWK